MEVSSKLHAPATLSPVKQPPYALYRRPQSPSGRYQGENNLLPLPGPEPRFLGHPARGLVDLGNVNLYSNDEIKFNS
jgi:hypothetical protein